MKLSLLKILNEIENHSSDLYHSRGVIDFIKSNSEILSLLKNRWGPYFMSQIDGMDSHHSAPKGKNATPEHIYNFILGYLKNNEDVKYVIDSLNHAHDELEAREYKKELEFLQKNIG